MPGQRGVLARNPQGWSGVCSVCERRSAMLPMGLRIWLTPYYVSPSSALLTSARRLRSKRQVACRQSLQEHIWFVEGNAPTRLPTSSY